MPDASSVPAVLFLCVHNTGRSQMAMGWFNHLAGNRALAWSGGSEPGSAVNRAAVEAMANEIERRVRQLLASLGVQPRDVSEKRPR